MAAKLFRQPFAPADTAEGAQQLASLQAFAEAHGAPYEPALVRRLLTAMTRDPTGVIALADGAGLRALFVVVDRADNLANAAILECLGVEAGVSAEDLGRWVVGPALAFTRGGERRALHVPLPETRPIAGLREALSAEGFAPLYETLTMRRAPTAPSPPPRSGPPEDARWLWERPSPRDAAEIHASLREMFVGRFGFFISPLPLFEAQLSSPTSRWRVLRTREDRELAGLVHLVLRGEEAELRTLGRRPAFRGRGLGELLLEEALRLLDEEGARPIELSVESDNAAAIALYQRGQFVTTERTPCWARDLT